MACSSALPRSSAVWRSDGQNSGYKLQDCCLCVQNYSFLRSENVQKIVEEAANSRPYMSTAYMQCILVRRFRWPLRLRWFNMKRAMRRPRGGGAQGAGAPPYRELPEDEEFEFDAYISVCDDNRDWVLFVSVDGVQPLLPRAKTRVAINGQNLLCRTRTTLPSMCRSQFLLRTNNGM